MSSHHSDSLTDRERQILDLVATGRRNREIAIELSLSEATVENHLHHVYGKLGVSNRTQAAVRWRLICGGRDQGAK